MAEDDVFQALADACIAVGEMVMVYGTPEMKDAMRVLLYSTGREIARRETMGQRDGASDPFKDGTVT